MVADIEIKADGQVSMAYRLSKGRPWHRTGVAVGDNMTPHQMMVAAGVDWKVVKANTFAEYVDEFGETKMIPTGRQALIRETDGKVLTEVGKGWNPVQNKEAFDFFNDFVSKGEMVMDTAGSLRGGQVVWALADVNESFSLFNGDKVQGYLLFSNPHRWGQSLDIKFVLERVVCSNTLAVALSEKGQPSVKLNHRSKFDADNVKKILGIGHSKMDKFKAAAEALGKVKYDSDKLDYFFGEVFGRSEKDNSLTRTGEQAMELIESQPGAQFAPGTMWNMYNSITYLVDHKLGREDDSRMFSATFGPNAKRKLDALDLAVKMAEAA